MINKIILAFALLSVASISAAFQMSIGQAWQPLTNYVNWNNFTIINWTYTQSYNSNAIQYQISNVSYAMLSTQNMGNPFTYQVMGYSSSYQYVGNVSYRYLGQYSNNAIIMVRNVSDAGTPYSLLSIFYNPIQAGVGDLQNPTTTYTYYTNPFGSATPVKQNLTLAIGNCNSVFFVYSCPTISPRFNGSRSFVVLGNASLAGDNFNLTFYSIAGTSAFENTSGANRYQLKAGSTLGNPSVQAPQISSDNAKNFYPLKIGSVTYFSGNGFEAYGATQSGTSGNTKFLSENMFENTSPTYLVANTFTSINAIPVLTLNQGLIQISSNTVNSVRLDILPAFTSNYMITTTTNGVNPNPHTACGSCSAALGWFFDFQQRELVSNIVFSSGFLTYAYANAISGANTLGAPYNISYGAAKTPYLKLAIPHLAGMGSICQNLWLEDYNTTTNTDYGYVTYWLQNATPASCTLVVSNTTSSSFVLGTNPAYNQFYVYFSSPSNSSNGNGFIGVRNSYILNKGTTYNSYVGSNTPFIVELPLPLNSPSRVSLGQWGGGGLSPANVLLSLDLSNGITYLGSKPDSTVNVLNPNNTRVLVDSSPLLNVGGCIGFTTNFITRDLSVLQFETLNSGCNWNYVLSNAITSSTGSASIGFQSAIGVNTYPTPQFTTYEHKLTTNVYQIGTPQVYYQTPYGNGNSTGAGLTIPVTTVSYLTQNTLLTIGANIQLPAWSVYILWIIAFMLTVTMMHYEEIVGALVGFIVTFASGVWIVVATQNLFVVFAVFLTILFALYEYGEYKHKQNSGSIREVHN